MAERTLRSTEAVASAAQITPPAQMLRAAARAVQAAEEIRSAAQAAEALVQVAAAVASAPDLERMAAAVLGQTTRAFGARAAHIFLVDPERAGLRLVGGHDLPEDLALRLATVPLDAPLPAARAVATRKTQLVEDLERLDPGPGGAREILARTGARSLISVPLVALGRVVGSLTLALPEPHHFTRSELSFVQSIAQVAAVGLANAAALEQERRLHAQLEAARQAALTIAGEFDLHAVLETIVEQARQLAGARYAGLGILRADGEPSFEPWVDSGVVAVAGGGLDGLAHSLGQRDAAVVPRPTNGEVYPRGHGAGARPQRPPGAPGFLGVPIVFRGRVLGNLYLADKPGSAGFSERDKRAVELLAQHAAVAVEHARVHAKELHDIGELSRVRDALRESEERYRLLAENCSDIITRQALDGRVLYASSACRALLGYDPAHWVGRSCLDFCHPDDRAALAALHRTTAVERASGPPLTCRVRRQEGDYAWLEVTAAAVRDPVSGEVREVQASWRDVTARHRIEEERDGLMQQLDADRTWLKTVIDRCPVGMVVLEGSGGEHVLANRRAEELIGHPLPRPADVPRDAGRVRQIDGAIVPRQSLPWHRALQGEVISGEELVFCHPEGRQVVVLVNASPIRDADGAICGAVVVADDISLLKEFERLREEWTSLVAHDLRQPITAIVLYARLLSKQLREPTTLATRALEHISASAYQLNRMIGDLLDVSRIEANRLALERTAVDLPTLLDSVVERMASVTARNTVRIVRHGEVPRVLVDPGRVEQIVGNLLSNAAKYGLADAEVLIEVAPGEEWVEVAVTNRGEGIGPDELPKLFTRFHRTQWVKRERIAGLGLGLVIARGLVEAHGGRIWAQSTPGDRTTFRFTLPVARDET